MSLRCHLAVVDSSHESVRPPMVPMAAARDTQDRTRSRSAYLTTLATPTASLFGPTLAADKRSVCLSCLTRQSVLDEEQKDVDDFSTDRVRIALHVDNDGAAFIATTAGWQINF